MSEFVNEAKQALDGMIDAFEEFKKDNHQRLQEQQRAIESIEVRLGRPGLTNGPDKSGSIEAKAWSSFIRRGPERMDDRQEVKSLIVSDDSRGGFLAPQEFVRSILKDVVQFSPVRQAAKVGVTNAGSVILPKRTGRPTAFWVGEVEPRTETGMTYAQDEIRIDESACFVDASQKLLEDAAINIADEIAADLAEEFGRQEGRAFILGDGLKQPLGILVTPGIATVENGPFAQGLQPDALINLVYALPSFYRNRGSFLMNSSTLAAARRLKDGSGNYLWQPAYMKGEPETLLGKPIIESVDMPDIATNAYPVVFGDFETAYRIYDKVSGFSLLRDPYSVATSGLVRFHARRRVGGQLVMPSAVKILKIT